MKNNIATTPDQGKRLLACGVDPKSADFVGMVDNPPRLTMRTEVIEDSNPYIVAPAWSLSMLIALLPNRILVDDAWYECQICLCTFGYEVRYHSEVFKDPYGCLCENPIEGCVEAIEWLSQNGYKLNEIKR